MTELRRNDQVRVEELEGQIGTIEAEVAVLAGDKLELEVRIPLTPRMFPVWDFVVGIFARKALLNMGRVLSNLSCLYLYE